MIVTTVPLKHTVRETDSDTRGTWDQATNVSK